MPRGWRVWIIRSVQRIAFGVFPFPHRRSRTSSRNPVQLCGQHVFIQLWRASNRVRNLNNCTTCVQEIASAPAQRKEVLLLKKAKAAGALAQRLCELHFPENYSRSIPAIAATTAAAATSATATVSATIAISAALALAFRRNPVAFRVEHDKPPRPFA